MVVVGAECPHWFPEVKQIKEVHEWMGSHCRHCLRYGAPSVFTFYLTTDLQGILMMPGGWV